MLLFSTVVYSHEYWLDTADSIVNIKNQVIVDIRNGQNYSGTAFPYDSAKYKSIQINSIQAPVDYKGRLGDYPAITYTPTTQGLHSISLESKESYLVYETWEKFSEFLNYHGLDQIKEQHLLSQQPKTQIKERYFRSAKTFFVVNGNDSRNTLDANTEPQSALAPVGSIFEMTALSNPYDASSTLSVQLLYAGSPLASRQVELFWKGEAVSRFTSSTDENGIATFNLPANGDYLFNAVHVVEPEKHGVHWVSYWASITFKR